MKRLFSSLLSLFLVTFPLPAPSRGQGAKATPDQVEKVHSRLFHNGPVGQIPDMVSKGTGDVYVPCVVAVVQRIWVSPQEELAMLASESDLVALAKAEASESHMNADKDFLYTDWNFTVEEVLKENPNASVSPGATIVVTRPGGKLKVNGRTVFATCAAFLDFASGQEYLLYLHFVPETGSYSIGAGARAYAVSATTKRLDSVNKYPEPPNHKDTLLKEARNGVAKREHAVGDTAHSLHTSRVETNTECFRDFTTERAPR